MYRQPAHSIPHALLPLIPNLWKTPNQHTTRRPPNASSFLPLLSLPHAPSMLYYLPNNKDTFQASHVAGLVVNFVDIFPVTLCIPFPPFFACQLYLYFLYDPPHITCCAASIPPPTNNDSESLKSQQGPLMYILYMFILFACHISYYFVRSIAVYHRKVYNEPITIIKCIRIDGTSKLELRLLLLV